MTSRQVGRRISTITAKSRPRPAAARTGRENGRNGTSGKEKTRLLQLTASALLFLLLVTVKLLAPAGAANLNQFFSGTFGQSMDVSAVFSAVGRAFSGSEQAEAALKDVYQAVFHPMDGAVEASAPADPVFGEPARLLLLREYAEGESSSFAWLEPQPSAADAPAAADSSPSASGDSQAAPAAAAPASGTAAVSAQSGQETNGVKNLSYILYSGSNLPDNVDLEQQILGFDYCVPVCGTLSSGFGYREHPVEGEERFHYGVDLAADTGTEIDAFADGTVSAVGESSSYGKYLMVAHTGNYSTLYAHCSAVCVSSGAAVREGQKIAEVGQTGIATGPHLHFELHSGDVYLNPVYYVEKT